MPLLGSLAVDDANLHPLGVDVGDPQIRCFGEPHARCIESGDEGSVLEVFGTREQLVDFLSAENHR